MPTKGVVLAAYPSCEDCLSWSDDGLAVAAGENMYIVQRVLDNAQAVSQNYTKWSSVAIRTDQFTQTEWPEQDLATLSDLSIGEEQSESIIVGLSWSPPGLGIHRRSVLGVLTSNLVLSIWETDGSQGGWQRTCVVNQHLPSYESREKVRNKIPRARSHVRIRAFAWCTPLIAQPTSRWGRFFVVVVDDNDNLTCFSISKRANEEYGLWSLKPECTTNLATSAPRPKSSKMTKLQRKTTEGSPVRSMVAEGWHIEDYSASVGYTRYNAKSSIVCVGSQGREILSLPIDIIHAPEKEIIRFSPSLLNAQNSISRSQNEVRGYEHRQDHSTVYSGTGLREWHEALESLCTDFDRHNHLNSLFRVRFWGFARSPDSTVEAACVSLHPWDTYEYTSAVHEKCRIVFRFLGSSIEQPAEICKNEDEAVMSILDTVITLLESSDAQSTPLDSRLLQAYSTWSLLHSPQAETHRRLDQKIEEKRGRETNTAFDADGVQAPRAQMSHGSDTELVSTSADLCAVCGSRIPIGTIADAAVCELGHPFSRCSLSLLSIQEPGISKYCGRCGRQFLNISKLGPQDGQSLLGRVFDAFDTCPYCDGKYRG